MEQDDTATNECVSSVILSKGKNIGISPANPKNRPSSVSFATEECDAADNDDAASKNISEVVNSPPLPPCLVLEHQHLLDRYGCCLSRLREAENHTELLLREITYLRLANRDLSERMFFLLQASFQKPYDVQGFNPAAAAAISTGFRGLCINENASSSNSRAWEEDDRVSLGLMENDHSPGVDVQRTCLPKCISVRSSGYLMTQSGCGFPRNCARIRPSNTAAVPPTKVYVRGAGDEEDQELEVYSQGMFKTELCNKWQETGACPYGENCQFAHGIKELRPVIRHPRYKTELCRMVLAGDSCPYGHRCHFRHALTDEEVSLFHNKATAPRRPELHNLITMAAPDDDDQAF